MGRVAGVQFGSGAPLLQVTDEHGDEVLVPMVEGICREIDPAAKRIVIDPPAGLIEVNRRVRRPRGVTVDIVTIFPRMVDAALTEGVVGRAREAGVVDMRAWDLRDFTDDRHRTVDDEAYGGGPGMVMKPAPIFAAVDAIGRERGARRRSGADDAARAGGSRTTKRNGSAGCERVVIICGRYEGVDERVAEGVVTDELSIGDYVLTGGELPALVVVDAVTRLVPGVVGDSASVVEDSFVSGLLDCPHYTRPAVFAGRAVPDVLLSGHHGEIERWRRRERVRRTAERRPDLIERATLSAEDRRELEQWRAEAELKENGDEGD